MDHAPLPSLYLYDRILCLVTALSAASTLKLFVQYKYEDYYGDYHYSSFCFDPYVSNHKVMHFFW